MQPADRYVRARELYLAVLDLPEEERSRRLEREAPDLRSEVEDLLARTPATGAGPVATGPLDGAPPEQVGPYRIVRPLGTGGMGAVFEAEQERPRRRVALKFLRRAVPSSEERRRFEREIRALARLEHQHIARIYDAGVYAEGVTRQPFFSMELVEDGQTLLTHASDRSLTRSERVRQLIDIARAVHYAHQRGVIHRDLKPANLLVDRTGTIKVLDFGIARVEFDEDGNGPATQGILGTIAYMSPEQARGVGEDLDVRTDVYSLGVVGYELLAGRRPYDTENLPLHGALQVVAEAEPRDPSRLDPTLGGDLRAILLRALEKDPARRYGTMAELANDLERHLEGRPVAARPPTVAYVAGRFARRHRRAIASAVAVLTFATAGLVGLGWGALRAHEGRREADITAEFTAHVLSGIRPELARGRDATLLRLVLDAAADLVSQDLALYPRAEARIRFALGRTYAAIAEAELARRAFERALELRRSELGEEHHDTLESRSALALLMLDQGSAADVDAAIRELEDVHAIRLRKLGTDDPATLDAANNLAVAWQRVGRSVEAEELLLEIETRRAALLGDEDPSVDEARYNRSLAVLDQGRYDEATELLEATLERNRRYWGDEHVRTLQTMNALAAARQKLAGDDPQALTEIVTLYEQVLEGRIAILGPLDPDLASTRTGLALVLGKLGQLDRAESLLRQALEVLPEDSARRHIVIQTLALSVLAARGQRAEAVELLQASVRDLDAATPDRRNAPPVLWKNAAHAGALLREMERYEEAVEQELFTHELLVDVYGDRPVTPILECRAALVLGYRALGLSEEASRWRARIP